MSNTHATNDESLAHEPTSDRDPTGSGALTSTPTSGAKADSKPAPRTRHPQKRAATESAEVLLGYDQPNSTGDRRPLSTTLGALFVFGRGLAGIAWLVGFALMWRQIRFEAEIGAEVARFVFWLIIGGGAIGVVALFLLAWLILRGSNFARVIVMLGLTFSVVTAAIGYFVEGEQITIQTTLVTVALDILVLLALSSKDSRAWARRPKSSRRDRQGLRSTSEQPA